MIYCSRIKYQLKQNPRHRLPHTSVAPEPMYLTIAACPDLDKITCYTHGRFLEFGQGLNPSEHISMP